MFQFNKGEIVGNSYVNSAGEVYDIVGKGEYSGVKLKYIISCRKCSKEDPELWPLGSCQASISNLKKGALCCGCSKSPSYNEEQYKVLIRRKCEELDFTFKGFTSEYKSGETKIHIVNNKTGIESTSCSIENLLNRPPKLSYKRIFSDEDHINDFKSSGYFLKGTEFYRKGKSRTWYYKCPSCSYDEYVTEGLCSGEFKGASTTLKNGTLNCRCNKRFNWTEKQAVYKIEKEGLARGIKFVRWLEPYRGQKTLYEKICAKGHVSRVRLHIGGHSRGNLNGSGGCNYCKDEDSGNGNGYYPERSEERDELYIIKFPNYIKVGRSFNTKADRLKGLRYASGVKDPKVLYLFTSNHKQVYESEQAIHEDLRILGLDYESGWTLESFTMESLPKVLELIETKYTQLKPVEV